VFPNNESNRQSVHVPIEATEASGRKYKGRKQSGYGATCAFCRDSKDSAPDAGSRIKEVRQRTMETCFASIMKAMLKSELASAAGVSRGTFRRWLQSDAEYMREQGVKPTSKMLPPKVVKYLIDKYCIEM